METPSSCPSCGAVLPEESTDCPRCFGETIDKPLVAAGPSIAAYKIVRLLAKGGMGSVYLAEDTLKRPVAIKIISEKLAQDSHGRNRFQREALVMATIEHPHVVHVHSFGEFSGKPYIVMEYVDGETLAERIRREGALPIDESLRILRQTIEALNAAYQKQIVHRDIKPSNILLDKEGQVHVADFGLAKLVQIGKDTTLTQTGSIIGTPHYISPEQAQGKSTDFRSDIYSLGVVLYEMLVGERPFEDTTPLAIVIKHLNTPMPSPREKRPELPQGIVSLLQWMTRKEPDKRPSSYAQLLEKVDSVKQERVSRKSRVLLLASLLVLTIGLVTWFQQRAGKETPITNSVPPTSVTLLPPIGMSVVTINALPWARVNLTPLTKEIKLPEFSENERTTPCNFSLPDGEYSIELSNDAALEPVRKTIKVQSGKANSFLFNMPAYDPKKALAQIRGAEK